MIDTPGHPARQARPRTGDHRSLFPARQRAHIAVAFSSGAKKLHADDIYRIWETAKTKGDLPKLERPEEGIRERTIERIGEKP